MFYSFIFGIVYSINLYLYFLPNRNDFFQSLSVFTGLSRKFIEFCNQFINVFKINILKSAILLPLSCNFNTLSNFIAFLLKSLIAFAPQGMFCLNRISVLLQSQKITCIIIIFGRILRCKFCGLFFDFCDLVF